MTEMMTIGKLEREKVIEILVEQAINLRAQMSLAHPEILPPEILLILAWEKAILTRYHQQYIDAPEEIKNKIDAAKMRCLKHAPAFSLGFSSEVDRLVKDCEGPAATVVINVTGKKMEIVSLLANVAGARPLWTYFYQLILIAALCAVLTACGRYSFDAPESPTPPTSLAVQRGEIV
jgi:hypothetical protein